VFGVSGATAIGTPIVRVSTFTNLIGVSSTGAVGAVTVVFPDELFVRVTGVSAVAAVAGVQVWGIIDTSQGEPPDWVIIDTTQTEEPPEWVDVDTEQDSLWKLIAA
jgi:hypothetical protein